MRIPKIFKLEMMASGSNLTKLVRVLTSAVKMGAIFVAFLSIVSNEVFITFRLKSILKTSIFSSKRRFMCCPEKTERPTETVINRTTEIMFSTLFSVVSVSCTTLMPYAYNMAETPPANNNQVNRLHLSPIST